MSKAFGMASWRIGYQVIPESLWDAVNKIQDTILICAPAVSQHAAIAALGIGREYAYKRLAALDETRRQVRSALQAPGLPCEVPDALGAFYFFVRVHTKMDSLTLAERLIRRHRIAVMPGQAFGATDRCAIRISYGALDPTTVAEGTARLVTGLAELRD